MAISMVSILLRYLASFITLKPVQSINKIGGILGAVFLEFRMQPHNLLRYLVSFFIFLPSKTYITAVIGVYSANFVEPFCTLKTLTLTCIQGQGHHINFDPSFRYLIARSICLTFDSEILTASASNTMSKLYAWRPLAAERLQISEIGRRILVALVEFHKETFFLYAVPTMR